MRLFTKILLASCLFIQTHPSQAELVGSMTAPDASDEGRRIMEKIQGMFKSHGEPQAIQIINGLKHKGPSILEAEEALGAAPVLCVEKQEGKLKVVATRRGNKELGTDLTADATHIAIVDKLKTNSVATVYYVDSTNRKFELLAFSGKLFQKDGAQTAAADPKAEPRCFYCATETEITSFPAGATIIQSDKKVIQ